MNWEFLEELFQEIIEGTFQVLVSRWNVASARLSWISKASFHSLQSRRFVPWKHSFSVVVNVQNVTTSEIWSNQSSLREVQTVTLTSNMCFAVTLSTYGNIHCVLYCYHESVFVELAHVFLIYRELQETSFGTGRSALVGKQLCSASNSYWRLRPQYCVTMQLLVFSWRNRTGRS